ncbi:MFS transporter [Streptomyces nojiriensis]|uniref:MFS transporter n=1 Tax=Streptomyces nojiriensis TaxID=66374 RepID=A0ABQ3SXI1_9ACTN|nr:MFS transporter [Streptomyces nojiriensis]GGS37538.1 MFS transporter [Streptomyces nojiriensis]GHI72846.1 MFS transporter [Streptomyces nojiriensis]
MQRNNLEPSEVPAAARRDLASQRRLVTANALSALGDGVRFAALPLLAAAVSEGDPVAVSLVAAAGRAAWLLAPVIGTLVDRMPRRRAMIGADLARCAGLVLLCTAIAAAGTVPVAAIGAVAFISGVAEVFFDSAAQAVVPSLAPSEDLERLNARLIAMQTIGAGFVGPPAGAALWAVWHPLPFLLNATTFLASALVLFGLVERVPRAGQTSEGHRLTVGAVLRDTWAGLRLLGQNLTLRRLVLIVAVLGIAQQMVYGILVVYVTGPLGLPASGYGWMLTAAAVGSLAGAKAGPWAAARLGTRRSLLVSIALSAASYLCIAAFPLWPVVALMLVVNGAGVVLWNICTVSLRQRLVPLEMLGRVTSGYRLAAWGVMPIGSVLGGRLADGSWSGAPWAVAGTLLLLSLTLIFTMQVEPERRSEDE